MALKPFRGYCYSCDGWHEFTRPRRVRRLADSPVDALIVKFECANCHKGQEFVMTTLAALEAGLKHV